MMIKSIHIEKSFDDKFKYNNIISFEYELILISFRNLFIEYFIFSATINKVLGSFIYLLYT